MILTREGWGWPRIAVAGAILTLLATSARSQTNELELIYSVNRTPEPVFETARATEVITQEEIRRQNARTLPELLMMAGVFVQQTNYAGGSPIIRGLMGKHVLILVDGARLNNATYRFGPLQYLSTIDIDSVERVEIVRGVGSVLASAMGGIINVITKKGPPFGTDNPLGGAVSSRYSSADDSVTGRAEGFATSGRHRLYGGFTYRRSGDAMAGGDIGRQDTGYDEIAGDASAELKVGDYSTVSAGYRILNQNDVSRADRILDGTNLVFDFDPQRLQIASLSFEDLTPRRFFDVFKATAQWNRQDEGRLEVRTIRPTVERRSKDSQTFLDLNLELATFLGENHRLLYGADLGTERISSTRLDVVTATGATVARRGNYTDGATYRSLGVYLQDHMKLGRLAHLTVGARFNSTWVGGSEESSVGTLNLESHTSDVTGMVNLQVHVSSKLNLVANVARGFRAPNIDDLSIFDERANGTEVPNPGVEPERILTYELGAKYASPRAQGSAFYFVTDLNDLMERGPGLSDGLSYFDLNGNGRRDTGEPNVLQRQNIGQARIQGFEMAASVVPHARLTLWGNFTYTQGNDNVAHVPLARIPPAFGTVAARWNWTGKAAPWIELQSQFAGDQRRLNATDVADTRIGPGGTDGFTVFHVRGGLSPTKDLRVSLALENIGDKAYKYHGSGVYRPGFQAALGLEYGF
jgi:hemoglobin/transferrin/lactoferrin receptor protein